MTVILKDTVPPIIEVAEAIEIIRISAKLSSLHSLHKELKGEG